MLTYKSYIGHIAFDEENKTFIGRVANTRDIITFQAETMHELEQAFIDSVEDYLEFCHTRNENPEQPF